MRKKIIKKKRGAPRGNKNAVGNHGGAPTLFKPEYSKQIVEFFDMPPSRKEAMSKIKGFNSKGGQNFDKEEFKYIANELPTITRFAKKIGVYTTTIRDWVAKGQEKNEDGSLKHPDMFEFYIAFTHAKELYKDFLTQNGLMGLYPPQFAIFIAKNTTDLKDDVKGNIVNQLFVLEGVRIVQDKFVEGKVVERDDN